MNSAEESPGAAAHNARRSYICKGIRNQLRMVSAPVYVAVMLFAMSTWIAIVGVWVEMPLLVDALPESWNLPSYLVIIIQCANLGTAAYAIWDKMRQRNKQVYDENQRPRIDAEVVVSLIIIFVAIASTLMMSLFWNHTMMVDSVDRSVVLLTLVSFTSLSSCTSSVVFLPYMARFPSVYISAYYFGQGLSGLLPGFLGLAQVAGQESQCRNATAINNTGTFDTSDTKPQCNDSPNFSVNAFFALISALLCVSAAAFCCLTFVEKCRTYANILASGSSVDAQASEYSDEMEAQEAVRSEETSESEGAKINGVALWAPATCRFLSLFVTIGVISALWNGILPATQTYTCLPYGDIVYKLSVCLSWIVNPLATLPNMLAPTSSLPLIIGLGTIASLLSALHLLLAAQSPIPILKGSVIGQVIVVSSPLYSHYHKLSVSVI